MALVAEAREQRGVAGWLRHPLVVALVSALIASILIPLFTRQWQDRQKELDLKRDLVQQIAAASTTAVRSAVSLERGHLRAAGGEAGEDRTEIYPILLNEWLTQRAITRSIVSTYFPKLAACWYAYSDLISDFAALYSGPAGLADEAHRYFLDTRPCQRVDDLPPAERTRYETLLGRVDWKRLKSGPKFQGSYEALGELLLIGRDGINQSIVASQARGYYHGPF
jgi:hypothetical protein